MQVVNSGDRGGVRSTEHTVQQLAVNPFYTDDWLPDWLTALVPSYPADLTYAKHRAISFPAWIFGQLQAVYGGRVIELYFMALLTPQTMQYKADSDAAAGLH